MTMSSKENDTLLILFDWMSGNLWDISWTLYLIYICFDNVSKNKTSDTVCEGQCDFIPQWSQSLIILGLI